MTAKWSFYWIDNGGGRQSFTVTAKTKEEAIKKGYEKAKKKAKGDCNNWECKLLYTC